MIKDMNALDQALQKAWDHRDKKINEIVAEVQLNYQWMYEALAAAKEAVDGNSAWLLPKTPCLKKRKIEEENKNDEKEEDSVIVEAKKPRKLKKRNSKENKRRTSKGRKTSTRIQSKASTQPVRASTRVTRASAKIAKLNESYVNSTAEKSTLEGLFSTLEVKGNVIDEESNTDKVSNTTKSFMEHEADLQNIQEQSNVNRTFNLEERSANNSLNYKLSSKEKEKVPKETSAGEVQQESPHSNQCEITEANQPVDEIKESMESLTIHPLVASSSTPQGQSNVNNGSTIETPKPLTRLTSTSTPDPASSKTSESAANDICKSKSDVSHSTDKQTPKKIPAKSKDTVVLTNTPKMPQIARIKEQLFVKLKSPLSEYTRKSPRLTDKTKSPATVLNTPDKLNTGKRKIVCNIDISESPDVKTKKSDRSQTSTPAKENDEQQSCNGDDNESCKDVHEDQTNEDQAKNKGPKIFKPIKPKNILTGVHSMIKAASQNQKVEFVQGPVAKNNNVVTGVFSFIKPNAPAKAETIEERKQRLEEDVRLREESRKKGVERAEIRRQKEIDDRKRRRQEREQRVADAQAKKAQAEEERIRLAQEKFDMMKKNEERVRKQKEKEEEMKRKIRERKMAEAEAKRKQEEMERQMKLAEKEEEEKRKAEYLQRKQEFEEQERKRKIEEQRRMEEERLEQCARERQLQEERTKREIEEREMLQKKRQEEKVRKEKEEREIIEKRRIEREKHEREVQERMRHEKEAYEKAQREKEIERARKEQEAKEREQKEKEAREMERKQKEAKERKEREAKERKDKEAKERKEREEKERKEKDAKEKERKLKEAKENERKEKELKERERREKEAREAYYKKKLEQKQAAENKRTFDKPEMQKKQHAAQSPTVNKLMHPPQHPPKVQCTSYKTPTLEKVKTKIRKTKSPSLLTYNIDDLSEDDSTDNDDDPAQEVPSWAKGINLKHAISEQINTDIDPYEIFVDMLQPPKLEQIFPKLRARFFKRTSSAHWEQPPRPFHTMI